MKKVLFFALAIGLLAACSPKTVEHIEGKNFGEKFAAAVAADEAAKEKDPESVSKDKGAVSDFEKMVLGLWWILITQFWSQKAPNGPKLSLLRSRTNAKTR